MYAKKTISLRDNRQDFHALLLQVLDYSESTRLRDVVIFSFINNANDTSNLTPIDTLSTSNAGQKKRFGICAFSVNVYWLLYFSIPVSIRACLPFFKCFLERLDFDRVFFL